MDVRINNDAFGSIKILIKINKDAITKDENAWAIGVINKFTKVER